MSPKRAKPGRRFRLLLYYRLYTLVRGPLILIALGMAVLWWRAPFVALLAPREDWLLFVGGLCLALLGLMRIARGLAYVQCFPTHLRIQTPLLRLAVSYERVYSVRPVTFRDMYPPSRQRWSQRHFLEPLYSLTGVGVVLKTYPISERWLRLWLSEYMFLRDAHGFLFLVEDWMALSRQIDDFRDRWRDRKAQAARRARVSMNPFFNR